MARSGILAAGHPLTARAGAEGGCAGVGFASHELDALRRWADKDKTSVFHLAGKSVILCKETVPRMDRVSSRLARRIQNAID